MIRLRPVLVVLSLCLLSGCSHTAWVKPGASQADFGKAKYVCTNEAMAKAPPKTGIYFDTSVLTQPHTAATRSAVGTKDVNEEIRQDLINSCLQANGWSLEEIKD